MNEMSVSAGLISKYFGPYHDMQSPSTSTIHRFIYMISRGDLYIIFHLILLVPELFSMNVLEFLKIKI